MVETPPMSRSGQRGAALRRALWTVAAVLAVAVVLWFTLREDRLVFEGNLTGGNFVPLQHHMAALRCVLEDCANAAVALRWLLLDVVGNFLLFIPVGLTLTGALPGRSRWRRWWRAVAVAVCLSVVIEAVQLLLPSRATDVDDVLFNAAGAIVGASLGVLLRR